MEMIYDNKKGQARLPKNIKQIGSDSGNRKVYIEDYAYSFISDIKVDEFDDGAIGILLGEINVLDDVTYVFVKSAATVTNAAVFTDRIAFTEETWPIVNNTVRQYFSGMNIVGWYLVSSKITSDDLYMVNKADADTFDNPDNVFLMINPAARDEKFYEKTESGLAPLPGYIVYYERNEKMQAYMGDYRKLNEADERAEDTEGQYRKLIGSKREPVTKSVKRHLTFVYCLSMLLIIVVLIIGVNSINNYDSNKAGNTDNDIKAANADINTTKEETVPVETVVGDVTADTEIKASEEAATKKPESTTAEKTEEATTKKPESTTAEKTEEATTKAPEETQPLQTEPNYQTYTVQQGDTYYKICEKFYGNQTVAGVNKILDFNGLTSGSELLPGEQIKIPD